MLTYVPQKTNMEPKKHEWFGKVFHFPISASMCTFLGATNYEVDSEQYKV